MKNLLIILIGFLALSCEMPTSAEEDIAPENGTYHMDNNFQTMNIVSTTMPPAKYDHQSFSADSTHSGSLAVVDTSLTIILFGGNIDSITFVYQVDGVEQEIVFDNLTDDDFDTMITKTILASDHFTNGIDFYDADGDGVFLDLDAFPSSGDYPVIAFKEVAYSNGTTWTNPDL